MKRRRCCDRLIGLIGPGGVGVFQWPYRTDDSGLVVASRWLRERLPGANIAGERRCAESRRPIRSSRRTRTTWRRCSWRSIPREFHIDPRGAGASRAPGLRDRAGAEEASGRRRAPCGVQAAATAVHRPPADADTVSDADSTAFNRAAEIYFTSLAGWDHHLAKPFSQIEETPALLMSVAVLLQALRLTPGMTVLEFGAGSGWLSRFLTQMGCRVVLLDVSPAALRIARELYARQPVLGSQPAPEFLEFDGRRIGSSRGERRPHRLLRRLPSRAQSSRGDPRVRRVLVEAGIAGFAEPGPRHAEAPRSQFESQTYGVVERDVDVHDLWRTAKACGFRDLRMCVFHGPPHQVSLRRVRGTGGRRTGAGRVAGVDAQVPAARAELLLSSSRGPGRADSRAAAGLACDIRATLASPRRSRTDSRSWSTRSSRTPAPRRGCASDAPRGGVALGHAPLRRVRHARDSFDFHVEPLTDPPREIPPGETVRRPCHAAADRAWPLPPRARLRRGPRHLVRASRLTSGGCWLSTLTAGA